MQEGLGDHILLLRLYEVGRPAPAAAGLAVREQAERRFLFADAEPFLSLQQKSLAQAGRSQGAGAPVGVLLRAAQAPRPLTRPEGPCLPCHLQAWQQAGGSIDWCRDISVDGRSMRFARDIRQQLARIIGKGGSGSAGPEGAPGAHCGHRAALIQIWITLWSGTGIWPSSLSSFCFESWPRGRRVGGHRQRQAAR